MVFLGQHCHRAQCWQRQQGDCPFSGPLEIPDDRDSSTKSVINPFWASLSQVLICFLELRNLADNRKLSICILWSLE